MKPTSKLEQDVLTITMNLEKKFPELSKYIMEMPAKISEKNKDSIKIKNLTNYYKSLVRLLEHYLNKQVSEKNE
ncbi:MAG: hypothetical protein J0L62_16480 [Bacteroidetes bacterium]|nr:hypothetical protein [Bacteroidota bacterium]